MNRAISLTSLVLVSSLCSAQDLGTTKIQCEGTYNNYSSTDMRDLPVKGMYVEISGDRVKVMGAIGFDATYTVVTRREDGLGIQLDSDRSYGGFINRFSGQLSLMEKGEVEKDGSFKVKQGIDALCSKAKSLF